MDTLNTLLETARKAKNARRLVPHDELISIVERTQTGAPDAESTDKPKPTLWNKGTLMNISIGIVATAALWLAWPTISDLTLQNRATENVDAIAKTQSPGTGTQSHNKSGAMGEAMNKTSIPVLTLNEEQLARLGVVLTDSSLMTECEMIIQRSVGDLVEDGRTDTKKLEYHSLNSLAETLTKKGYDIYKPNGIAVSVTKYVFGRHSDDFKPAVQGGATIPNPLRPVGQMCSIIMSDGSRQQGSRAPFTPLMADGSGYVFNREKSSVFAACKSMDIDIWHVTEFPRIDSLTTFNKCVPLRLNFEKDGNKAVVFLWFVPTPQFVALLSPSQAELVRRHFAIVDNIRLSSAEFAVARDNKYLDDSQQPLVDAQVNLESTRNKIAGIEYLDLSPIELRRLGVQSNGASISMEFESRQKIDSVRFKYPPEAIKELTKQGYSIDKTDLLIRTTQVMNLDGTEGKGLNRYNGWDHSSPNLLLPVGFTSEGFEFKRDKKSNMMTWKGNSQVDFISDNSPLLQGEGESLLENKDSKQQKENVLHSYAEITARLFRSAIPVQVEINNFTELAQQWMVGGTKVDSTKLRKSIVRIWFVPTRDFVENLPERYRDPLMKEFNLYERYIKGDIPAEQLCKEMDNQKSYLDVCRLSSGQVKSFSVFPNPATNRVTVQFTLAATARIHCKIYSFSGEFVKEIQSGTVYNAGAHNLNVELGNLEKGAYLIALSSDKGEQVVQRIIVQ